MNTSRCYHQSWIAAAETVFALLFLIALCRGQDMPPMPPVFPIERVLSQPTPEHMLLSPKASSLTNDAAMVSVLWDYSVPMPTEQNPVLLSPKGSEARSVAMSVVLPPATNIIQPHVRIHFVTTTNILCSVSSATRPIFVEMATNIFMDAGGSSVNATVLCPAGAAIVWENNGTNEIEWSTNGTTWIPTNVRWCNTQSVNYYVNPTNRTMFYRKVERP